MIAAKDYAGAIGVYEGMVAKVPALTSLYLQIGGLYRNQKQYDKAHRDLQEGPGRATPTRTRRRSKSA